VASIFRIVCSECGSENVRRDATAAWSFEAQVWQVAGILDCGTCEDCECERRLMDIEVADENVALTI
jgi:hypothetical protein